MKAQVEEIYFYLFLSIGMPLYQEGRYMVYQQSLNAQQKPKT
jgi:hypothetical protein